jgi:hypothetical protein
VKAYVRLTLTTLLMGGLLSGCGAATNAHPAASLEHTDGEQASARLVGADAPSTDTASHTSEAQQSKNGKPGSGDRTGSNGRTGTQPGASATSGNTGNSSSTNGATAGSVGSQTVVTPATSRSGVELGVTVNFGRQSLFGKRLGFQDGDTVMDVLQDNLDVDTAYGGGFVNAIQGVKSGYTGQGSAKVKQDWFFWVNGSIADMGASDYQLKQGDDVWWDFHSWEGTTGIPAVIGQYPHPFTTGYRGVTRKTTIYYGNGEEAEAKKLQVALQSQGAGSVDVTPYTDAAISSRTQNTVVLGTNSELLSHTAIRNLLSVGIKRGEYIQFGNQSFTTLRESGTTDSVYGAGSGAILAIGNGSGDTAPVWVVAGVDPAGLDAAVSVLTSRPASIYHMISAVITKNGVVGVPRRE